MVKNDDGDDAFGEDAVNHGPATMNKIQTNDKENTLLSATHDSKKMRIFSVMGVRRRCGLKKDPLAMRLRKP